MKYDAYIKDDFLRQFFTHILYEYKHTKYCLFAIIFILYLPQPSLADTRTPSMPIFVKELSIKVRDTGREAQQAAWSPNGDKLVVLASIYRFAKIFSIPSGKEISTLRDFDGGATTIAFLDEKRVIIPPNGPGAISFSLWNYETGNTVDIQGPYPDLFNSSANHVADFRLDKERKRLIGIHQAKPVSNEGFRIVVFDAESWKIIADHRLNKLVLAVSPDGRRFAVEGDDGEFLIVDAERGTILQRVRTGGETPITSLAWSSDSRFIATSTLLSGEGLNVDRVLVPLRDSAVLRVWNAEAGTIVSTAKESLGGFVESIDFSPDGRFLATCSFDGTVRIWESEHLDISSTITSDMTNENGIVKFSPDGNRLALVRTGKGYVEIYRKQ